jgi:hypothetical protein
LQHAESHILTRPLWVALPERYCNARDKELGPRQLLASLGLMRCSQFVVLDKNLQLILRFKSLTTATVLARIRGLPVGSGTLNKHIHSSISTTSYSVPVSEFDVLYLAAAVEPSGTFRWQLAESWMILYRQITVSIRNSIVVSLSID